MMTLRDYQSDAVASVWKHLREKDTNPCVVIPTAGGKSLCIAQVAKDAVTNWDGRVLCLAHVKELIEQNAAKIRAICPELKVGVYSAGLDSRDTREPVIVAGIQSICGHADLFKPFDIIMVDEAHLIPSEGEGRYRTFLAEMKERNPNVRLIGWTATPYRTKGGLICKPENLLNEVCYEISVKTLINRGFISHLVSKSGTVKPDLSNLHVRAGEFVQKDIDAAMGDDSIVTSACREIVDLTKNRKTCLIFCTSVKHCERVAELIRRFSGEECPVVTGDTPPEERADTIRRMRGETVKVGLFDEELKPIRYCCNVSVLTTGTDIPNIDTVVLLRPTASAGLLVQMVGRGFRLSPKTGKTECLVLDYGKNIERFGCIDQIKATEPKGGPREGPLAKECPQCRTMMPLAQMCCPNCGYLFERKEHETHLDSRASSLGIISGEVVDEDYDVRNVDYRVWLKRDAKPGAPRTVRITYTIDLMTQFSEWLCPEHSGYARKKFETWWKKHTLEGTPMPGTADDVCEFAFMGMIRQPKKITVRRVSGSKYPEIIGYELADEAEKITPSESDYMEEDDIPF